MWIKTETNKLFNLRYVQAIEAIETNAGWVVNAHFAASGQLGQSSAAYGSPPVPLATPKSEEDAQHIIDEIAHALENSEGEQDADKFLDLSQVHLRHGRHLF